MKPLLLITVLVTATLNCVRGQSSCSTPYGARGRCISIYQCDNILALLNKPNRSPIEVDLLRKSQCGFRDGVPAVCCPDPCYTPEGSPGSCISIYSCPHLSNLLKPPVSSETMSYVKRSRCQGPEQYSVCCGPPPPPPNQPTDKNGVCIPSAIPPDPSSQCCGLEGESNKIIGGTATSVDQYPWLTIIEYRKDNRIRLLCGGALISARYVLTAGHCVIGNVLKFGTPVNVRLSEYDTSHDGPDCVDAEGGGVDCTGGIVVIPIEQTIPHPDYNPENRLKRNDIALIRLQQLAPYTDFVRPICLPQNDVTLNPPDNFQLWVAGWGAINETHSSSNVKLHVKLPYRTLQSCQPAYSVSRRDVPLWGGQMCAGGEKGKDSCKGDSGGPLMYQRERFFEVIGIVSFGPTPCGIEDIPGVYTKVIEYIPWIQSSIRP